MSTLRCDRSHHLDTKRHSQRLAIHACAHSLNGVITRRSCRRYQHGACDSPGIADGQKAELDRCGEHKERDHACGTKAKASHGELTSL